MKLKINNQYQEIDFWSFMKCFILVDLALMGMVWGGFILLGILLSI